MRCRPLGRLSPAADPGRATRRGRLSASGAGRVRGRKATGTLKVTDKVGKTRCASPTVKFTATGG